MDGKELKLQRVAAGLTLWDLAREVGIHPSRISKMGKSRREVTQVILPVLAELRHVGGR